MSPEPTTPDLRVQQVAAVLQSLDPEVLQAVESRLSDRERQALATARRGAESLPRDERLRLMRAVTQERRDTPVLYPPSTPSKPRTDPTQLPAILRPRTGDTARLPVLEEPAVDLDALLGAFPEAAAQGLRREQPALVALVLASVSSDTAQSVLAHLPPSLARESVLTMVQSSLRAVPGTLSCIAEALAESVEHYRRRADRQSSHAQLIARTIIEDEPEAIRACLESIRVHQPGLAREVEEWVEHWRPALYAEPALPALPEEPGPIREVVPAVELCRVAPEAVLGAL